MTNSDWITLGAAILVGGGTLFLGIMAWRTIHQTRSIQKAEKRERLLNEIIEWTVDILSCGHETEISSMWTEFITKPQSLENMQNILIELLQDKFEIL